MRISVCEQNARLQQQAIELSTIRDMKRAVPEITSLWCASQWKSHEHTLPNKDLPYNNFAGRRLALPCFTTITMYTPRQPSSSLPPAQSSLDPSTGIRVVIKPSQSAYFAGEPFTCTITFTNTRPSAPSSQIRSLSGTFNPSHKRAAHSVSSAPLARPPTSPGTPKTAQPFLSHQTREGNTEDKVQRKGLIGKPITVATAVLEKKRRNVTRSLSVDITPQDIVNRLSDQSSPHPPQIARAQSEKTCM